jgi:polar amino acid transport system substrate-binding protein
MNMMKKTVFLAIIALVVTGGVFAGAKKEAAGGLTMKSGVLSIGMEIGYPPLEYYDENNQLAGFDVQMAYALGAKLGLKPEFVDTSWDGIFAGVSTSRYDCIISAVTLTEERKLVHNFTKPYIGNAQAIITLKTSAVKPKRPEELSGLGVAYQAETTSDIVMTRLAAGGLKFTPYEYDKVTSCFDELKLGRTDAILCDSLVAVDYLAVADTPFEMVWQGDADEYFAICLKKGNDALTSALDKALDELFADGTMRRISQEVFKLDMVSAARK